MRLKRLKMGVIAVRSGRAVSFNIRLDEKILKDWKTTINKNETIRDKMEQILLEATKKAVECRKKEEDWRNKK